MEAQLLKIKIKIEMVICQREGMIILNKGREYLEKGPWFTEMHFQGLSKLLDELGTEIDQLIIMPGS